MGQKVNPIGFRLGLNRTWDSVWFAEKGDYGKLLHEDMAIRASLMKHLKQAAVAKIIIERPHKKCRVTIHSGRPGVIIGKKGADIEKLRKLVMKLTQAEVMINVVEIRKPEIDATLVADSIAQQLERRVAFRRAMKRAVQSAMRLGVEGIRINCAGRLGGAEIARLEWYREGRVPLHTLRSDIDYGTATAFTTYGTCGIKVWICKGDVIETDPLASERIRSVRQSQAERTPSVSPKISKPIPAREQDNARPAAIHPSTAGVVDNSLKLVPFKRKDADNRAASAAGWPEGAEREMMEAFDMLSIKAGSMDSTTSAERTGAIGNLLKQGRTAMRSGVVIPRALSKRVAAIMPALFDGLFDPSSEVRWAAAYAIAAIRSPTAFERTSIPVDPDQSLKDAVVSELTNFLQERKTRYITEVDLKDVSRAKGKVTIKGSTLIHDHMPLEVAGARPALTSVKKAVGDQNLEVEIAELDGRIVATFDHTAPTLIKEGPIAICDFEAEIDDGDDLAVRVKITFAGHRLQTHLVKIDQDRGIAPA